MQQSTNPSHTRLPGRVDMLGQQYVQVERQNAHSEGSRSDNRFQCIPGGMGSLLLRTENRESMVPAGTFDVHYLESLGEN